MSAPDPADSGAAHPPSTPPDPPHHTWLLTHPRTASNLLLRILNLPAQTHLHRAPSDGNFFLSTLPVRLGPSHTAGRPLSSFSAADRTALHAAYTAAATSLVATLDAADAQGTPVFAKEHVPWLVNPVAETRFLHGAESIPSSDEEEAAWTVLPGARSHGNDTALPDAVLLRWARPVFLIRHPALVFASAWRTVRDLEGVEAAREAAGRGELDLEMGFGWERRLWEWYRSRLSGASGEEGGGVQWPLVLDADDAMEGPEVVRRFAEIVGLDSAQLRFSWDRKAEEEKLGSVDREARRMLSTLIGSEGVVKGLTSEGLDLDVEVEKWKAEFGVEDAARIEGWVRAAIPDYEFLRERRLRV